MTYKVSWRQTASKGAFKNQTNALSPFLWCILCIIAPAWITTTNEGETNANALVLILAYLVILYAGTRISRIISLGNPDWLPFMFWSFTYIWVGLAMFAQDLTGQNPYNVTFSPDSQEMACVIALSGMIAFDVGALWSKSAVSGPSRLPREVSRKRLIVFILLTLVGVPLLLKYFGGVELLFTPRSQRSSALTELGNTKAVNGIILSLITMAPLVASACIIALLRTDATLRRKPAWLFAGGACILVALIVTNPVANARYISGSILLGLLFSIGLTQKRRVFRATSSLVFMALLLVFPYLDLFRYTFSAAKVQTLMYLLTVKGDYDSGAQMVAVSEFRQATGGTDGKQILGALGFFIPRSYWPDKPLGTGSLITEHLGVPLSNVSSPLWVEAYVDGGLIAVVVVFAALGYVMTRASHIYVLNQYPLSYVRIMVPLVAAYSLIVLRGSLLTAMGPLMLLLALGWLVTRRESEGPGASPTSA